MKMKKSAALLAAFLTLGSVFSLAACGGDRDTKTPDGKDRIRMFIVQGNYYDGAAKDSVWEELENKTNTSISMEGAINNEDYYTTLNPMLNTGDFPDVFFCVPGSTNKAYNEWADEEDGILINIDDILNANPGEYPNLETYLHSEQYANIQFGGGRRTLIPYTSAASGWGIYWREDWLKAVGEVNTETGEALLPQTLADFERVFYKFTYGDPDGNGKKDTYGMSPGNLAHYFQVFIHAFGGSTDWDLDGNDKLTYQYTTQEAKNCLTWLNKLYADGVIDPEFNTNNNDSDRTDFEQSRSGCIVTNAGAHVAWVAEPLCKIQGYDGIVCMGPAPLGTGKTAPATTVGGKSYGSGVVLGVKDAGGFSNWGGYWGGFSITKACKNPEAVCRLFDYLLSEEGSMLVAYGIEGVHYTIEDGKIVPNIENREKELDRFLTSPDENGNPVPTGFWNPGITLGPTVDMTRSTPGKAYAPRDDYKTYSPKLYHLAETADLYNTKTVASRLINVTGYPSSTLSAMAKIEEESSSFFIQAIMGKKNLTSDWDEMISNCSRRGWDSVEAGVLETAAMLGIV